MSSGVNMLINILKISDTTKTESFDVIFCQIDQKYDKNTAPKLQAVFSNH